MCGVVGFSGSHFECAECKEFDLCEICAWRFHTGVYSRVGTHDRSHRLVRRDTNAHPVNGFYEPLAAESLGSYGYFTDGWKLGVVMHCGSREQRYAI